MSAILACLAAALVGVEAGWRPLPTGGMEYIIQVEPGTLEALRPEDAIESDVPAEVRDVRHYRIVVGRGPLPKQLPAGAPATAAKGVEPTRTNFAPATGAPAAVVAGSPPGDAERWPGRAATGSADVKPFVPTLPPLKGAASPLPPKPLSPDPAVQPLVAQSAGFLEPSAEHAKGGASSPAAPASAPAEPQKPWLALWLTALLLCGSLGGNVYLGWIAWGTHSRCRAMLRAAEPGAPTCLTA
jgi:hypothetical protein